MFEFSDVAVAHAIQLAVAPVFLLSGIGAMLAVMTNRLGRIIDRARDLEERLVDASPEFFSTLHADLRMLSRRAKLIYAGDCSLYDDGVAHLRGYRLFVRQRLSTIRRFGGRRSAFHRRDVDIRNRLDLVSTGNLCSYREPSYRATIKNDAKPRIGCRQQTGSDPSS